jgi:hypothetical protein
VRELPAEERHRAVADIPGVCGPAGDERAPRVRDLFGAQLWVEQCLQRIGCQPESLMRRAGARQTVGAPLGSLRALAGPQPKDVGEIPQQWRQEPLADHRVERGELDVVAEAAHGHGPERLGPHQLGQPDRRQVEPAGRHVARVAFRQRQPRAEDRALSFTEP